MPIKLRNSPTFPNVSENRGAPTLPLTGRVFALYQKIAAICNRRRAAFKTLHALLRVAICNLRVAICNPKKVCWFHFNPQNCNPFDSWEVFVILNQFFFYEFGKVNFNFYHFYEFGKVNFNFYHLFPSSQQRAFIPLP